VRERGKGVGLVVVAGAGRGALAVSRPRRPSLRMLAAAEAARLQRTTERQALPPAAPVSSISVH